MDLFEFNKIAGAVLATGLGVMAVSVISDVIYTPSEAEKPGYEVAVAEPGAGGEETAPAAGGEEVAPIAARLQTASVATGEAKAKACLACHTFDQGGAARVGPNLYGVVGGPAAHMAGFKYSQAMLDKHDAGMTWTLDNLDHFLTAPKDFVPGTAMGFAGLKNPDDRASVIAYLNTLSDNPLALPSPSSGGPAPQHSTEMPPPAPQ